MNCELVEMKIADFVTDRLPSNERSEVEAHLGSCSHCREFRERVRHLYAIEDTVPFPVPSRSPRILVERRRQRLLRRVAALILFCLGTGYAVGWYQGRGTANGGATDEAISFDPLPLPTISVALPEIPSFYPAREWLESVEEAEAVASLTGRPILTEYYFTECPRCQYMNQVFKTPEALEELDDYVLVRIAFSGKAPPGVKFEGLQGEAWYNMPALQIRLGTMKSPFVFAVGTFDQVAEFETEWSDGHAALLKGIVGEGDFRLIRDALIAVPSLLGAAEFGRALALVDVVVDLGEKGKRSTLIDAAASVREEIETGLAKIRDDLEHRRRLGGKSAAEAVDLAQRLAARLEESPLRHEFLALAER